MTTTPEVQMPEVIAYRQTVEFQSEPGRVHTFIFPIDEHPRPIGAEDVCTLADAIAYADARFEKLQIELSAANERGDRWSITAQKVDHELQKMTAERDALAEKVKALRESARGALRCLCEQVLPLDQDSIDIINSSIISLQSVLYATPEEAAIDSAGDQP